MKKKHPLIKLSRKFCFKYEGSIFHLVETGSSRDEGFYVKNNKIYRMRLHTESDIIKDLNDDNDFEPLWYEIDSLPKIYKYL